MWRAGLFATFVACGGSRGAEGPGPVGDATCEGQRGKLTELYRAEATVRAPDRIEAEVADNVAMVLGECSRDPARVAPCVARATTLQLIERQCLAALDEEGSEGDAFVDRK